MTYKQAKALSPNSKTDLLLRLFLQHRAGQPPERKADADAENVLSRLEDIMAASIKFRLAGGVSLSTILANSDNQTAVKTALLREESISLEGKVVANRKGVLVDAESRGGSLFSSFKHSIKKQYQVYATFNTDMKKLLKSGELNGLVTDSQDDIDWSTARDDELDIVIIDVAPFILPNLIPAMKILSPSICKLIARSTLREVAAGELKLCGDPGVTWVGNAPVPAAKIKGFMRTVFAPVDDLAVDNEAGDDVAGDDAAGYDVAGDESAGDDPEGGE